MAGKPLRIIAANGPFTLDSNLEFEPFKCLLSKVEEERPDVLILIGPFISEKHSKLLGNLDPADIFFREIISPIAEKLNLLPYLQVILVPSTMDLLHPYCVFPQPPMDLCSMVPDNTKNRNIKQRITCLPNPCVFAINECSIAVTGDDILMELSMEEIARITGDAEKSDRMGRLIGHILKQRRYSLCLI